MKRKIPILAAILCISHLCSSLWASPTTAYDAEMAVRGWLKLDPEPLGAVIGPVIASIDTFTNDSGEPIYYVVYLAPSGLVFVSADDAIEPIIAFAEEGAYDPSFDDAIGALVTQDVSNRISSTRIPKTRLLWAKPKIDPNPAKWMRLQNAATETQAGISPLGSLASVSDIRVAPFIETKWGQGSVCGRLCYNYYTPNNYPCGCVATAMAQLMYYHRHPEDAYVWDQMVPLPDCNTTELQLQAIGNLCHDAGVAAAMEYGPEELDGSETDLEKAAIGLRETFEYGNIVLAWNENVNIGAALNNMINPNIDAEYPVILGITGPSGGHAVLVDGYGYNASTLYHHLNVGPEVDHDVRNIWYNLPTIDIPPDDMFTSIEQCLYNIFPDPNGKGEFITGRVLDVSGNPIEGAVVTAIEQSLDSQVYSDETNNKGIYALVGLEPRSTYVVYAEKPEYEFPERTQSLGKSNDFEPVSANVWGIDFRDTPDAVGANVAIGKETFDWNYPLHTGHKTSRAQVIYLSTEIERSGIITKLALDISKVPGERPDNWTIRIKQTDLSSYSDDLLDTSGWTIVYQGSEIITGTGWKWFVFQTPFRYNGTSNLLIDFSHKSSLTSSDGECRSSVRGERRSALAHSDSGVDDPLLWSDATAPSLSVSDYIPNIKLTVRSGPRECKLTASNGNPRFGSSVSIDRDHAVIGLGSTVLTPSSFCPQPAYIFRCMDDIWTEEAAVRPLGDDRSDCDTFGQSVSISGDYAIIGDPWGTRCPGSCLSGYVYKRSGDTWIEQVRLVPSGAGSSVSSHGSVSISGDYAIVGYHPDNAAYVFKRNGDTWSQQAILMASDGTEYDDFGYSVSISGDYAIIGAYWDDNTLGSAYVFRRSGDTWIEEAKLTAPKRRTLTYFGGSVSIDGNFVIVGVRRDYEVGLNAGAAHIFRHVGDAWVHEAKLMASDGAEDDYFGHSVSISGDRVVVGAFGNDDMGDSSGSAYLFRYNSDKWLEEAKLIPTDSKSGDYFGQSVSICDGHVIVGAMGSAYVYKLD